MVVASRTTSPVTGFGEGCFGGPLDLRALGFPEGRVALRSRVPVTPLPLQRAGVPGDAGLLVDMGDGGDGGTVSGGPALPPAARP